MIQNFFLADSIPVIAARLAFLPRVIALCLILALGSIEVFGQACNCPPAGTCAPCAGGLSRLTLRYNGVLLNVNVAAFDQGGQVYNNVIGPGDIFSFQGTQPNEKFQGSSVLLTVLGVLNTSIPINCGGAYLGANYGSFTVVGAESKDGGTLCCLPGTNDTVNPVISNCPTNISVSLPATSCSTAVSWTAPTATDNCSVSSFVPTHSPGGTFQLGNTPVTYTAIDGYGNQSTCSFSVTVNDNTNPVISGCPGNITATADANCKATVSWVPPTITDNCTLASTTSNHSPGEVFSSGTITPVTYIATDGKGNVSTCTFNVIVEDKTKPVITNCPVDKVVPANSSCQATVSWATPLVSDNCLPILNVSHASGSTFPMGETQVTYTATDPSGNSETCVFKVIVINPSDPEVTGCPKNITVNATNKDSVEVTWIEPQATVLCGEWTPTQSHHPGDKFPIGTTTVEYEFTDQTGKSSPCSFNVLVLEPDALFAISKVVTPDGDGINDIWFLSNIENFKSNTVVVIDRWGNRIFQATGYDNVRTFWNGTNSSGTIVPTGTYFYTIEVRDQDKIVQRKGFLEVIQ